MKENIKKNEKDNRQRGNKLKGQKCITSKFWRITGRGKHIILEGEGGYGFWTDIYPVSRIFYVQYLKELFHEIEMGCLWYGWKEPYLEMNL